MICIENVTFGYNKYHNVLEDFSMEFKQSGVYGLLGKNGTGKSTLQYLIAGLLRPFSGEVRVDGVLVAKRLPDTMQNIFFVPEEYKLPEVELLRYVKALKPFYPRFSDEILNGSLDKFDLTTDLYLGGLSMGQKKKVYMCIALAANTRYLLLDEPTNGMDILSKSQFRKAVISSMLGVCRPGDMGFDVMHINLHKTFSTPHGGGGPGSGPVGVRQGLECFFPQVNPYHGNFGIELRALAYILTLGKENIKRVGPLTTLNANYIKESLKDVYELPITGICMHEFVFNGLKDKSTGVTTMDVAKRLLDFGYHAPTIYFPLLFHESMMIEPTENESKETIDNFIEAMRAIAKEAAETPDVVTSAPRNTPITRVDDVMAAKSPILTYKQLTQNRHED